MTMILESRTTKRKSDFWRGIFIFLGLLVVSLSLFSVRLLMAAIDKGGGSGVGAGGASVGRSRGGLAASLENFRSGPSRQQGGRDERLSDGDFARPAPDRDDVSRPARDSDGEKFPLTDSDWARQAVDGVYISRPARDADGGTFSSKGDVLPPPARDSEGIPFATGGDALGQPARDSGANAFKPRMSKTKRFVQTAEQRFGIVKMKEGAGPNAWKAVDWDEPISAEDELTFECNWSTFTSSSGERANICDVGGPSSTSTGCPNGRYFKDIWYRDSSRDGPIFVEVGAGHGACVLELLLETSSTILAFEPHPKNVYHVRKAMMRLDELDRSMRDRVRLFPIGLSDEAMADEIEYASKKSGQTSRHSIHSERLDRVLDMNKMTPSTKLVVNLDVQGFECKILEGIGQMLTSNIELIKLKWQDDHQECGEYEDYLQMLRRVFGVEIWRKYSDGTFDQFLPHEKKPVFNGVDLFATKN